MKLISMDGKQCFDQSQTCRPYFRQPNRFACRKYCEFNQEPRLDDYTCRFCNKEADNYEYEFDSKCLSK